LEKEIRRRINIATSVKGIHTFDATVEIVGGTEREILEASDSLVRELDARYPVVGDK
jgi:hypothetical protein